MNPIQSVSLSECLHLRGIFCDLDDTLTTDGKLLDVSYQALWNAYRQGLKVVVVTGRPAGWADHIARMWPVNAVIGENGAFYFWMDRGKMCRHFVQDVQTRSDNREKLDRIRNRVLNEVPRAAISADQKYRESDLAVDHCEDIPHLSAEAIEHILLIFREEQAQVKLSSIHVNGWFGDFDKLSTCRLLMEQLWSERPGPSICNYLFCGDSPNDEPMFAGFAISVGVANIRPWLSRMKSHPVYQTSKPGGEGFAEMVECILQKRAHAAI